MSETQRGTLSPGEGESVWFLGDLFEVKLASEDTGGAYSIVEETSPPQGGAPPHIHYNEDEALYVLEGEVEVLVGDRTTRAIAGSLAYNVPKGTLHTFKNIGTSPSRVLFIYIPGGFEKFFLEAGEPASEGSSPPEGEPDVGRIVEIGQKYGLEIPPPPGQ